MTLEEIKQILDQESEKSKSSTDPLTTLQEIWVAT